MSRTQLFEKFSDFQNREDKTVNGFIAAQAKNFPDWEQDNATNVGCWNCRDCKNMYYSEGCSGISNGVLYRQNKRILDDDLHEIMRDVCYGNGYLKKYSNNKQSKITTELTSKHLKANQMFSWGLTLLSFVMAIVKDGDPVWGTICLGGIVWMLATRVAIWWQHK